MEDAEDKVEGGGRKQLHKRDSEMQGDEGSGGESEQEEADEGASDEEEKNGGLGFVNDSDKDDDDEDDDDDDSEDDIDEAVSTTINLVDDLFWLIV